MESPLKLRGVVFVRGSETYASRHALKTAMQHLTRTWPTIDTLTRSLYLELV